MPRGLLLRLQQNWKAGLTVALVNIPLSISLALAGGGTPLMGIITAIWAGLIAALLGGSHFNIVGPAGALSAVLATFALTHGVGMLPILAVAAGILTLAIFLLRWEKYIIFIPGSVIHGFTLGVALTIGLNQLNFALGLSGLPPHERLILNIIESLKHLPQADVATFAIFLVGTIFLFLWNKRFPLFPGAILLAPVGIVLGYLSSRGDVPFALQTLFTKFGDIEATLWQIPSVDWSTLDISFLSTAFAVMVILVLETLISAKIADGMAKAKTKFDRRKEVLGIGIANIVAGIFGGMPASGVFARTALNVRSGANHRTSGVFNAIVVAVISLIFLPGFKFLPLAVVASILVFAAIRMVQTEHFRHLWKSDKMAFGLSMLVAGLTVGIDSVVGIVLGAAIALLVFVNMLSKGESEITVNEKGALVSRHSTKTFPRQEKQGDVLVYRLAGPLTYVNSLSHIQMIEKIRRPHTVILGFRNLFFVDMDGSDAIAEMIEILQERGIKVAISGVSDHLEPFLAGSAFYKAKKAEKMIFESTTKALEALDTHRKAKK